MFRLEVAAQRFQTLTEVTPEKIRPVDDLPERFGTKSIEASLAVATDIDELSLFEHSKVLRDRSEGHLEGLGEFTRGALAVSKDHEDLPTGGVGNGVENVTILGGSHNQRLREFLAPVGDRQRNALQRAGENWRTRRGGGSPRALVVG